LNRFLGPIIRLQPFRSWDALAMGLSGLCLIHCTLTSVMFGLLATLGGTFASPIFHEVGLGFAIVFALIAFTRGLMEHGMILPSWVGGAGLVAMSAALMVPHGGRETLLTMIGVALLALGHWLNRRAAA
jgi:hypothetical protein